jgi:hypothetical protein
MNVRASAAPPIAFPALFQGSGASRADAARDDRSAPAALGGVELPFQSASSVEKLARAVHRDGLPIARLWETPSTLLSIGLNRRGKPGIWINKKIH